MNHVFRLVWHRARSEWRVASELSRRRTKGGSSRKARAALLGIFALPLVAAVPAALAGPAAGAVSASVQAPTLAPTAHPTGGHVTAGQGTIQQQGSTTTVTQNSQALSLSWQSFDIGSQATVDFVQPSANAIAVNRIGGSDGSVILGHLNANGQIFLINPNGVLFGRSAQVNVGGLVASTMDVSDSSLGSNSVSFTGEGKGSVVNQGTITAAKGGYVALLGHAVSNQGVIHAQLGSVALAGGSAVTLSFDGDRLVNVRVDKSALNALVENGQLIEAEGGNVWMTASARDSLLATAVNNTGVIDAQGVSTAGGVVRLVASGGNTTDSGSTDVSGAQGGTVQVLSNEGVGVTGNVNASGTLAGGSIRVGGGYQGGEGLSTASATYVGPSAHLDADASQAGNGGSVVVWANQANDFLGHISARGGAQGGNGGQVETSAHSGLNAQGQVDASAPHGEAGTWLLDPYDVTIQSGGASFSNPYTAAGTSTIDPGNIDLALTGGTNVYVFTNTSSNGTDSGNITVNSAVTASGAGSLYLEAAGSIILNNSISGDGTDPLNVHLWANYGGSAAGTSYQAGGCSCSVQLNSGSITTDGGNVDIVAAGQVTTGTTSTINTGSGTLTITAGTGITAGGPLVGSGATTLNAGAGAITAINGGNDVTGDVSLSNAGPNNVTLGDGANALTLGAVSVGGNLSVSGGGITLTQNVTSGAAQTYQSQVTLAGGAGTTLAGSAVNLEGGVAGGGSSLSITGNASMGGTTSSLSSLSVSGATTLQGSVATTGTQSYVGPVTLSGDSTLTSTGASGNITFGSTVDGGYNLGVFSTSGNVSFGGAVGGVASLASLTASGAAVSLAGNVSTGGAQHYTGTLSFGAVNTALTGSAVTLVSALSQPGENLMITGGALFSSSVALASLSVSGGATLFGNVTTSGTQSYSGSTQLDGSLVLDSAGASGGVQFGGAVTSSHPVTVEAPSGGVTFGSGGGLFGLTTQSSTFALSGTLIVGPDGLAVTTTGGPIAPAGAFSVAGASSFSAGTQPITLTNAGNDFMGAVGLIGGTTAIDNDGPLILGTLNTGSLTAVSTGALDLGAGAVTGNLTAAASGAIWQDGALTVTGAVSVTQNNTASGAGQDVALNNAGNAFAGSVSFAAGAGAQIGNLSLTNSAAVVGALSLPAAVSGNLVLNYAASLALPATSVGGELDIVANGISQTGAVSVTGASNLNAGSNAITLTNAGNGFQGAVTLTGGATTIDSGAALTLGGLDTGALTAVSSGALDLGNGLVTGSLTATASGLVSQSGALNVTGTVSITQNNATVGGAGQDIVLDSVNSFDSTVSLVAGSGAQIENVSLENGATSPGALSLPASIGGNLTLYYGQAALTVPAAAIGGSLDATAAGGIVIAGGVSTGGGQVYRSPVTLTANTTLASTGGGAIEFDSTLGGSGILTLDTVGSVALDGPAILTGLNSTSGTFSGGALTIGSGGLAIATTGGPVTQAGAFVVNGSSSFNAGSRPITLTNAGNDFAGTVSLDGGDVALANADPVGTQLGAGAVSGTLMVASNGGITQSGALLVLGTSEFNAGSQPIALTNAGNDFQGAVSLTGGTSAIDDGAALTLGTLDTGALTAVSAGALDLGAGIVTGTLTAAGSGEILQSGALNVIGAVSVTQNNTTAGVGQDDVVLDDAGNDFGSNVSVAAGAGAQVANLSITNSAPGASALSLPATIGGNLTLTYAASVALPAASVGGMLTVQASGISQTGPLSVTGTSNLNAGGNAITLSNAGNGFQGAVSLTGGTTKIVNGSALTLGGFDTGALTAESGGALDLGSGRVTGSLTAAGSGLISQDGALSVTGAVSITQNNVAAGGTGQDIVLDSANIFEGAMTISAGSAAQIGSLSLTNDLPTPGALSLPARIGGNLTLNYPTATLTVPASAVGGSLDVTAADIVIANDVSTVGGQTYHGPVTLAASATLASTGGGAIELTSTLFGSGVLTLDTGGAVTLAGQAILTGLDSTSSTFTAGALNIGSGGLAVTTTGGAVTQTGAFVVSGASSFDAGSQPITLTNTGNDFAGTVSLDGGDVVLANADPVGTQLGTAAVSGILMVDSDAPITQSGALQVTGASQFNAGSQSITLSNRGNDFQGAVSLTGGTAVLNGAALTLGTLNTGALTVSSAGDLSIASGGSVTAAGAGDALVLIAGNRFINDAGSSALRAPQGSWLIWSQNAANDTLDGLVYGFKQYDATYGTSTVQGVGNGVLYTVSPVLTVSLTGSVSKTYDGTTAATLSSANFSVSGQEAPDTVVVTGTGAYDTPDAGARTVTASGLVVSAAQQENGGSIPVYGYQLSGGAVSGVGSITPAPLTITANDVAKTYDGAAYSGGNGVTYSGWVGGQGASVLGGSLSYGGTAQGAVNAGQYVLTPGGLTSNNYTVTYVPGTLTVSPATLTYVASPLTVDAGSALPALSGTVVGFVNGDSLASATTGTLSFSSPATAQSGLGHYAIDGGGLAADNGNYVFVQAPENATALTVAGEPIALESLLAGLESQGVHPGHPQAVLAFSGVVPKISGRDATFDQPTAAWCASGLSPRDLCAPAVRVIDGGLHQAE